MPFPSTEHQFKPGNPGGPGRKKGSTFERIRELLDQDHIQGKPIPAGKTVHDLVAEVFIGKLLQGKHPAYWKLFLDRMYGPVIRAIEVSGPGGGSIPVQFENALMRAYGDDDGKNDKTTGTDADQDHIPAED